MTALWQLSALFVGTIAAITIAAVLLIVLVALRWGSDEHLEAERRWRR